jgi:O-Antigen ligase
LLQSSEPIQSRIFALPATSANLKSASIQFWILAVFMTILFLTGGASRGDAQSLVVVRPLSAVVCAIALLTLKREHVAGRKWLLGGFTCILLVSIVHLIPLPPSLWQALQGREILADVDRLAKLGDVWRPLTMTAMNGWHALASLITPLGLLLLGVQLGKHDLYRLLPLLLGLGGLSGLLGMLQIMSDPKGPLYLYAITNNGSAIGFFANRNHAGVFLACLFPMLATYASIGTGTVEQQRLRQLAAIAAGIVLVPLILVTGSRSGMLMSLPALVAAAMLYRKPVEGKADRRTGARFTLGIGHVAAAAVLVSMVLLTIFYSRAEAWERLFGHSAVEDARADYWGIGLQMIWAYFPFGSGMGSFVEVYQINEPLDYLQNKYVNHMHNDWLEIPLTAGLPAVVILLVAVASYLLHSWNLWRRKDQDRRAVKIARLASVLVAIIGLASATDYPLRTPIMMALFAIACLWFTLPALADEGGITGQGEES